MKRLLLALGTSLLLAGAASAQDITVGVAGPITGSEASFGRQMENGAEQAVADINAAGGVLGKKLKLEVGDDACDPKQARSVAEKFASEQVPMVAGHYCSSSSIPASEAYAEGNVLQITPASTNPTFTERGLWNTFRVCGRDDQQGAVAAAYLDEELQRQEHRDHQRQVDLWPGSRRRNQKGAEQGRHQREGQRGLQQGRQGLHRPGLEAQKLNRVDIVYVGGYHQDSGLLLRQMRSQGKLNAVLMAGDALWPTRSSRRSPVAPREGICSPSDPTPARSRPLRRW